MSGAVFVISSDGREASTREFHRAASRVARKIDGELHFVGSKQELLRALSGCIGKSLLYVSFVGHGTPTWWGLPGKWGVNRLESSQTALSGAQLARWIKMICHPFAVVSFASCQTGASPKWYRTKTWGKVMSPWGAASHADGGELSLAGKVAELSGRTVTAHTTTGHTTHNPAIRVFDGTSTGISMAKIMLGRGWENTPGNRREWNSGYKPDIYETMLIKGGI